MFDFGLPLQVVQWTSQHILNINFFVVENAKIKITYPMEFVPQADGSRQVAFKDGTCVYETKKASFQLDGLFNNKELSDNMNKLLNENWQAVLKDLGEAVPVTMEAVVKSVATGIFSKISV